MEVLKIRDVLKSGGLQIKKWPVILSEAYFSGVEGPAFGIVPQGLRACLSNPDLCSQF
jgi:hypothetical protein